MIFRGPNTRNVFKDPPNISVLKLLVKYLRKHGDKLALMTCYGGPDTKIKKATYSEILQWACSIAEELRSKGVTAGDYVLFICDDKTVSVYCLLLGTMLAGATAVPTSTEYLQQKFEVLNSLTCLKWVFYDSKRAEFVKDYIQQLRSRPKGMLTETAMEDFAHTNKSFIFEVEDVEKHIPLILFTSGSHTGYTNAVTICDSALKGHGQKTFYDRRMADIGPFLVVSSLHWAPSYAVLIASIFHGFPLFFSNSPVYLNHLNIMEHHKIKSCLLLSTQVNQYTKFITCDRMELFPSLRHVWITGSQTRSMTKELLVKKILDNRTEIQDVYGTVEIGIVTTWDGKCVPGISKKNAVGYLKSGVECKVKDENGQLLNSPKVGHLWFKSYAQFTNYWRLPKLTADSIDDDGFFKTGDIGYFDDEGLLYVIGKADTLNHIEVLEKKENLADYLRSHKGVLGAVVLIDKKGGLQAFVLLKDDLILPKNNILALLQDDTSLRNSLKGRIHKVLRFRISPDGKPCTQSLLAILNENNKAGSSK